MQSTKLLELGQKLGLEEQTLGLARLFPLVYVAWSDGQIQPDEAKLIREAAEKLGISEAASLKRLDEWLSKKPSDAFIADGLHLLAYLVASLSEEDAKQAVSDVSSFCQLVAKAAGGFAGHRDRTEAAETLALRDVALRLQLGARPNSRATLQAVLAATSTGSKQ